MGTKYLHGFLASSPLRFGLRVYNSIIFWVRRPLLRRISEGTGRTLEHHLDVDELKKFGLAKEIAMLRGTN
jgi:hypothetical protein